MELPKLSQEVIKEIRNKCSSDDSHDAENDEELGSDEEIDEELTEEELTMIHGEEKRKAMLEKEEKASSYEVIYNNKLKEGEKPLEKVVGHESQKKEILSVIDWFKHSKELKSKGISIPRGVLLFGGPGNGKSLLIKEIIKCCEAPVFIFQGENRNVVEGIIETFKKAREAGHAIIVFDELDLLIDKEKRVVRALQENLDGVESYDDILVLAATNYLGDIPRPLLRHGRLDKIIRIPDPTSKEAVALLKKHFKEFGISLPLDFEEEEVGLTLNGISCAGVKAVVNDIVLRNGFENITSEMIDESIYRVTDRIKSAPEEDNIEVAIHEASHAVVAKSFPEFFTVSRLNISGASGEFSAKEVEKGFWPYDKQVANIKISMAGVIAQKLFCGRGSGGCDDDLQKARSAAYNLFNISGYSSCWETLPAVNDYTRRESQIKLRRMERKIEAFLRKCEKETIEYVKQHETQIRALGKLLFQKKHLKSSEILSVIG